MQKCRENPFVLHGLFDYFCKMNMKKVLLLVVLSLLLVAYGSNANKGEALATRGRYEIPTSNNSMPEVYLERMGYTVSFNPKTNIPNWVAWELNSDKIEQAVEAKCNLAEWP